LEERLSHSELTPHLCTNSLHLNVAPPVCLKGSLYCEDCLNKVCIFYSLSWGRRGLVLLNGSIWPYLYCAWN
jgi:hypothetical protein